MEFRRDDRGQTLVIVALMLGVLLGFSGLVADIGWYELNLIRMQRAADAAALAGVVYLPNNVAGAVAAAKSEATKNGFRDGVGGVVVNPAPDVIIDKILNVDVTAPVPTFFARLFGVRQFGGRRTARAEFILPIRWEAHRTTSASTSYSKQEADPSRFTPRSTPRADRS